MASLHPLLAQAAQDLATIKDKSLTLEQLDACNATGERTRDLRYYLPAT